MHFDAGFAKGECSERKGHNLHIKKTQGQQHKDMALSELGMKQIDHERNGCQPAGFTWIYLDF